MRRVHHRGFSLIELMVVLGIIMMIAGMLAPIVTNARRSARAVQCRAQLHQVGQAVAAYASANRGRIPMDFNILPIKQTPWWEMLFSEARPKVMQCPLGIDPINSYMLNLYFRLYRIHLGQKLFPTTSSETVLAGEVVPGLPPPQEFHPIQRPDFLKQASLRHGPALRANYLWLDFHVSNEPPRERPNMPDPWWVMPPIW